MEGSEEFLMVLNQLLADELTAFSQNMVHSEIGDNWGYVKLHPAIEKQARHKMHHTEWLIQRSILFEGTPVVPRLNPRPSGRTVPGLIGRTQEAEPVATRAYSAAFGLAHEASDQATADLLATIHNIEDGQVAWDEKQRAQAEQKSLENYLAEQTASAQREDS